MAPPPAPAPPAPAGARAAPSAQFYALAVVAGTGLGAVQAASRTLLTTLIPRGREAELFGFYSPCGKSAAIVGPLVFGSISYAAGGNQRVGILTVGAFFAIGILVLSGLRAGGPTRRAAEAPLSVVE